MPLARALARALAAPAAALLAVAGLAVAGAAPSTSAPSSSPATTSAPSARTGPARVLTLVAQEKVVLGGAPQVRLLLTVRNPTARPVRRDLEGLRVGLLVPGAAGGVRWIAREPLPWLAPRAARRLVRYAAVPRVLDPGRYRVRVCARGRCTTSARADVRVGPARLLPADDGPSALDLGATVVDDTPPPVPVALTNDGETHTGPLTASVEGSSDVTVDVGPCAAGILPGGRCTVLVRHQPTSTGPAAATVRVAGARSGALDLRVEGSGTTGVRFAPRRWDFGEVPVGAVVTRTFELRNSADTAAVLRAGFLDPGSGPFRFDYDAPTSCLSFVVPAQGSCTLSITYAPPVAERRTAEVTMYGEWPEPLVLELSGTGVPAAAAPSRTGPPTPTFRSPAA